MLSSQHSEIVPVHFASCRGHSVPRDQSHCLPHESCAFDGKSKCRLTIGNRVAQSNEKRDTRSTIRTGSCVPQGIRHRTTLFTGAQLYLPWNNFIYLLQQPCRRGMKLSSMC